MLLLLRRFAALVLLLTASALGWAEGRVECSAVKSAVLGRPVRYCALLPASFDAEKQRRYPVLFFLHGLGDNEQSLVTTGAWNIIEDLQRSGKIGDLVVVTPDGDRSFYLNSHDGRVRYEDFFIREFIPAIERKYRAQATRTGRAIGGVSMGGYGALHMAFKYPRMFVAVTAHMPAIYDKLPPALTATARADVRGFTLDANHVFGSPPDETFWQQNNPLTLARQHPTELKALKIYFDCGDQDEFGFDAGARALDRLLTDAHVMHEAHIYPGNHSWTYVAAHFSDSIEFQWKALAAARVRTMKAAD